ncbi:hypothetical protein RJ55_01773 [Drechmeria coniospora]|nr:hypothetical protein RJ55_01773 [Drechmeria coniospora]
MLPLYTCLQFDACSLPSPTPLTYAPTSIDVHHGAWWRPPRTPSPSSCSESESPSSSSSEATLTRRSSRFEATTASSDLPRALPITATSRPRTRTAASVVGLEASLFELQPPHELYRTDDPDLVSADRTRPRLDDTCDRRDRHGPYPAVRITRNTHSAILYALEEALRHPLPFTPDVVEESADMADLVTSAPPLAPGSPGMPSPRRPTAGPAPTGSPSGIRSPRMIMQERAAREARQRAEAEKLAAERSRAEQEARLLEEARQKSAKRRSSGPAAQAAAQASTRPQDPQPPSRPPAEPQAQRTKGPSQRPAQVAVPLPQPPLPQQTHQPGSAAQGGGTAPQPDVTKTRNSFPHAFERWETLSAHWEGLTSYWIRKLEQNKDDVNRDPVSQQLARQVTDLSAAGANLFHAVVELQRLRASSERKFQRWFFETRAELERAREMNAMLESAIQKERRDRADAIRDALDQEQGASKVQKQIAEMRKELSISKEEARRAWEELGRREQEERDRTYSLQTGQPTIVGGVQVVPMTQGVPGRQGTTATTTSRDGHRQEYGQDRPEHRQPQSAPRIAAGYVPSPSAAHAGSRARSEGGYSEGEYVIDAQGSFIRDVHGNKIPFAAPPSTCSGSDTEADEYGTPATTNPSGGHEPPSTSAVEGQWAGAYEHPQDYTGQGYAAPGWETVPRHHHPTRLSDVIEEDDERSRTSASQISRA